MLVILSATFGVNLCSFKSKEILIYLKHCTRYFWKMKEIRTRVFPFFSMLSTQSSCTVNITRNTPRSVGAKHSNLSNKIKEKKGGNERNQLWQKVHVLAHSSLFLFQEYDLSRHRERNILQVLRNRNCYWHCSLTMDNWTRSKRKNL